MTPLSNNETRVESLIEFSKEFSIYVTSSVTAVENVESSIHGIKTALSSIPSDLGADNVVSHELMQNIARRDLHLLLKEIIRIEAVLAQSLELLIKYGNAALNLTFPQERLDHQQGIYLYIANKQVAADLGLLIKLQLYMLASIRSRQ
ncbi:hypothetical protein CCL17_12460 [Pseudomonas congelans]|uniref:hypothetical protein n=1 Tax=Pseudomonas congelans TaxID=200452 RepID=UPI000BB5CE10|nr:hypothetical protein [Pseudomonas congelans]PBQ02161.1 hypothetical protein CCL17_12460 [Pseudomonas congelans]